MNIYTLKQKVVHQSKSYAVYSPEHDKHSISLRLVFFHMAEFSFRL